MTMTKQFKVGDRVTVNERGSAHKGKQGSIKYVSGSQYWVKFDDGQLSPPLHMWMLDPA